MADSGAYSVRVNVNLHGSVVEHRQNVNLVVSGEMVLAGFESLSMNLNEALCTYSGKTLLFESESLSMNLNEALCVYSSKTLLFKSEP